MARESSQDARGSGGGRYHVIVCFLLGLAVVDALVASQRQVWRAYDPDVYREKVRNCHCRPRDLVLIGGSPVCEGLDPAELTGLSWAGRPLTEVYNLGLSGATTSEIWHSVEHGLCVPPRLLVYGITASDLNDSRDEPHGPRSLMEARDVLTWIRLRPKAAEWCLRQYGLARLSRSWNLFHFRNGIRLWAAHQIERLLPEACPEASAEARRRPVLQCDPEPGRRFRSLSGLPNQHPGRTTSRGPGTDQLLLPR